MKKTVAVLIHLFFFLPAFAQNTARPNVLLIVTDDMKWNDISLLDSNFILPTPGINRIGQEGANITCYSTNSLCVPGRTSLFSGKYGHKTGAMNNSHWIPHSTIRLPQLMHDHGYYVGLIGKWMIENRNPKPDFNYWLWTPNQTSYFNDTAFYFSTPVSVPNHMTDFVNDSAVALLSRIDTPFFLIVSYNAPHIPCTPQTQYDGMFDTTTLAYPANFSLYTQNYPSFLYDIPPLSSNGYQYSNKDYISMIAGIDNSVNKIMDTLTSLSLLENTMVIFMTDNSYLMGEHRLQGKSYPYEDCMRMPLFIRYPQWYSPETIIDSSYSLNVDLAPTILEAAGITDTLPMDGTSIRKIQTNQFKRKEFLYEQMPPDTNSYGAPLRTIRDRYFEYTRYYCSDTTEELFDMVNDPLQLNNLVHHYAYQPTLHHYRLKLDSMRLALEDTAVLNSSSCYLSNPVYTYCSPEISNSSVSICNGDSYYFIDSSYNVSGDYSRNYINIWGCDSIISLHLNVISYNATQLSQQICQGETFNFNGTILNAQGIYSDTLSASTGCDSVIVLNLTILTPTSFDLNETICAGEIFDFNGQQISSAGNYSVTLVGVNGCDSVVNLSLAVLYPVSVSMAETICAGSNYNFNGINLSASGIYMDTLSASTGCDSVINLNLTVMNPIGNSLSAIICSESYYNFDGINLNITGIYTDTLNAANGCDSVIHLNLTVLNPIGNSFTENICSGSSYNFNGIDITATGIYIDTLSAFNSCDSVIHLNLTVMNPISNSFTENICNGDSYNFNGVDISVAGIYTDTLTSMYSCDSVVILTLNLMNPVSSSPAENICAGDNYYFNGVYLSTAGIYIDTLNTIYGCDSIVNLNLTVLNPVSNSIAENICDGDIYNFNGVNLNTAGIYIDTLNAINGCDSIVNLNLTVLNAASNSFAENICSGTSYNFNGVILSTTGIYADTLSAFNGCDSVVMVNLTVETVNGTIVQSGDTLMAQTTGTLQWLNCNTGQIISGITGNIFIPVASGNYAAIFLDGNCTDTSACYHLLTGLEEYGMSNWQLSVYPNPFDDEIIVQVIGQTIGDDYAISITDILGRELFYEKMNSPYSAGAKTSSGEIILNLKSFSSGIYFLKATDDSGIFQLERMVKE